MKNEGDCKVQLHVPTTLPQGKYPGTHWIVWVGPRVCLDTVERSKTIPLPGIGT